MKRVKVLNEDGEAFEVSYEEGMTVKRAVEKAIGNTQCNNDTVITYASARGQLKSRVEFLDNIIEDRNGVLGVIVQDKDGVCSRYEYRIEKIKL